MPRAQIGVLGRYRRRYRDAKETETIVCRNVRRTVKVKEKQRLSTTVLGGYLVESLAHAPAA